MTKKLSEINTVIMFLSMLFACRCTHPVTELQPPETKLKYSDTEIKQSYFLLDFKSDDKLEYTDTLFVKLKDHEAVLAYKQDTVAKEFTYENITNFISPLGTLACRNLFIMQIYNGDGCPVLFKLLHFRQNGSWVLSDSFGNCNALSSVNVYWPFLELKFDGDPELKREPCIYKYNTDSLSFKKM